MVVNLLGSVLIMSLNHHNKNLFHVEIMRNIYLISGAEQGPTEIGISLAPGTATGNSYLILSEDRAVLVDLAVNLPALKAYAEELANGRPLQLILTHGHCDHTYYLEQFSDVWMHPADETLIRNGMLGMPPVDPCPRIHPLNDGDVLNLGGHSLVVINIPGHTDGSILLLDRRSRVLFSGDTCARRLLYGVWSNVPLHDFCDSLRRLYEHDFDIIYSAHDRCALPKAYILHMIDMIQNELPHSTKSWYHPAIGETACLAQGDEYTLQYFDMVAPRKYLLIQE